MEVDKNMAEPVRNDGPLSNMRFPQSPVSVRTGPVPATRVETDSSRALPEAAEPHAPIGEWPEGSGYGRVFQSHADEGPRTVENLKGDFGNAAKKAGTFMRDRLREARRRFEVIRGRAQSGELQEDLRERADDLMETAQRQARWARSRTEYYANRNPMQFIAVAAAGAFVFGFLLRMWREE